MVEQFAHFMPLIDQAIAQATRRVIYGEVVPAKEKLLSVFEPHPQFTSDTAGGTSVNVVALVLLAVLLYGYFMSRWVRARG